MRLSVGRQKARNRPLRRLIELVAATFYLGACATLGSIEQRTEEVNKLSGNYIPTAILLNVARASQAEPINFASITAVTGHDTLSVNIGLPTIILGPGRTP